MTKAKILRKKYVSLLFSIGICCQLYAQTPIVPLQPIGAERRGLSVRFIYGKQIIDQPSALQIPLLELGDPAVRTAFEGYVNNRKVIKWLGFASAGFSLYTIFNREKVSSTAYWTTVGSTMLVSTYFNIRANKQLVKAISRYNTVLRHSQVGITVSPLPSQSASVGLGWRYAF